MRLFLQDNWRKILRVFTAVIVTVYIEGVVYHFAFPDDWKQYWIIIPACVYVLFLFANKFTKEPVLRYPKREIVSLGSLMLFFSLINCSWLKGWCGYHFQGVSFVVAIAYFCGIIIPALPPKNDLSKNFKHNGKSALFNLFYLNTSKAHEIAMLIDNKIMKTIEREQISEELLKSSNAVSVGKSELASAEIGYSGEESSKKRVYENFDVKTTKSIMLRKIYETAVKNRAKKVDKSLKTGDLTLFENIELQQMNVDDTVMILNALQDSKLKNQANDSVEINLSKMMEKMLDDFTIDYLFSDQDSEKKFIIRLPYKSTQNFENGYHHSDLQLGKLSIIGIYRGEIDFSKKESISSRFLDLITQSYNHDQHGSEKETQMKLSYTESSPQGSLPFEFRHKELNDKLHLIDVIAIIQEINFEEGSEYGDDTVHL
jgi:hypothetical protein